MPASPTPTRRAPAPAAADTPGGALVLHLGWNGRGPILWAEDVARAAGARLPGQGRAPRPHPFAADAARLRAAAAGSAGRAAEDGAVPSAGGADPSDAEGQVEFWLPSRTGAPLGSWEGRRGSSRRWPLRRWRVPALVLEGPVALRWLLERPEPGPEQGGASLTMAPAAAFWRQAARYAVGLASRRAFLPYLWLPEPGGAGVAMWRTLPGLGRERRVLAALAEALPPVDRWQQADRPPEAVVESFLSFVVDRVVRSALASRSAELAHTARGPSAAARWVRSLLAPHPTPVSSVDAFARDVAAWTEGLTAPAPVTVRLCLRLEEPGGGSADDDDAWGDPDGAAAEAAAAQDVAVAAEAEAVAGDADRSWYLRFFVQPADEPSLLLPADAVWEGGPALAVLAGRGLAAPRGALVTGLGRAAVAFPPLGRALDARQPVGVALSAEEAHDFLEHGVENLRALDVGVQVPAWWSEGPPTLSATFELGDSSGLLGADSLVAFGWELALGEASLTAEEFLALAELKQPLVRHHGRWVVIGPGQADAVRRLLERTNGAPGLTLGEALHTALAPREGEALRVEVRTHGAFAQLLGRLGGDGHVEPLAEPAGFFGELRPYQRRGAGWLAFLADLGLGACLADDMGLGKTVQMLTLLLARRAARPDAGPTLLVCPTSLLGNWAREAARFAPTLRVGVHHGPGRARAGALRAQLDATDLLLTTYGVVQRDLEDLHPVPWDGVVLDEAQNIKNPSTRQAQAARALRARWRTALTGTPVENKLADLWSLFAFLNPGYLGSSEAFAARFAAPVEQRGDSAARTRLQQLVRPFLLRRAKTDPGIADELPPKIETRVDCHLTPEQATLYQAVVDEMIMRIDRATGEAQRHGEVLAALLRLKQVCNHPAHYTGDDGPLARRSGKLARLEELLDEALAAGDQALIFTQFPSFGQRVARHLERRFGRPVLSLYGGLSAERRTELVRRFQEGAAPLFLVSLRAGGTGLNLTAASHVFHFDRWWNPAVEDQATDRAYRIGQRRSVQVHKFVCVGTLEERIDELIQRKKALAAGVLGSGEGWLAELSTDDLRELFHLSREALGED